VTCDELLGRLDDYLDRNLSPEELNGVEEHLENCLACLQKYRFEQALLHGIRSRLRRISVPPHLMTSIRLRLNSVRGD
jgi:anti-sigma factor (TIGR02949 family)